MLQYFPQRLLREASETICMNLSNSNNRQPIFFSDFAKCWIGDPRLQATDKQSLAVLRQRAVARNALPDRGGDGVMTDEIEDPISFSSLMPPEAIEFFATFSRAEYAS